MSFFKKKYKFYPSLYGCAEKLAIKIFADEKEHLEKILGRKIKVTSIHHTNTGSGYVDYIVYTIEKKGKQNDKNTNR